ncbi:hypothetical protein K435DRAFT_686338 [Dendrothele bispora CBS 962.96]|uniref:Uncharacterized protein n=1 Tax=Dendrothele bispora (strain CBS 962.96) TaxID=1314807 RepID=A0A4S8L9X6_DENBC|nr:hypothetical protein K435DRAFT_686338 [Dendrothele bispora CBS 962.96]
MCQLSKQSNDTSAGGSEGSVQHDSAEEKTITSLFNEPHISTKPYSLTMPQASPGLPPRPEFMPFAVPFLCRLKPYDGKDFWTYPERCGWIINAKDEQCHPFCPPGHCEHGMSIEEISIEDDRVRPLMFSRSDGTEVLGSDKVSFLQAWLFFGVLKEVSSLCGLDIDIAAEFIIDEDLISTEKLNCLPGRWFEATMKINRTGDRDLVGRILTIGRHSALMLRSELIDAEQATKESYGVFEISAFSSYAYKYDYTYAECRVLHSLDLLVRTIGLHLLLHIRTSNFNATAEDFWRPGRIVKISSGLASVLKKGFTSSPILLVMTFKRGGGARVSSTSG